MEYIYEMMEQWNKIREMDPYLEKDDCREELEDYACEIKKDLAYRVWHIFGKYMSRLPDPRRNGKEYTYPDAANNQKVAKTILACINDLRRRVCKQAENREDIIDRIKNLETRFPFLHSTAREDMINRIKYLEADMLLKPKEYVCLPLISAKDLCNDLFLCMMMKYALATGIDLASEMENLNMIYTKGAVLGLDESQMMSYSLNKLSKFEKEELFSAAVPTFIYAMEMFVESGNNMPDDISESDREYVSLHMIDVVAGGSVLNLFL